MPNIGDKILARNRYSLIIYFTRLNPFLLTSALSDPRFNVDPHLNTAM